MPHILKYRTGPTKHVYNQMQPVVCQFASPGTVHACCEDMYAPFCIGVAVDGEGASGEQEL